jgi:hypothetical protein
MTITELRDFDEIVQSLRDAKRIFLVGCSECATTIKTGGEDELQAMKKRLEEKGFEVTGSVVMDPGCHVRQVGRRAREHKEALETADVALILSCGGGVQSFFEATGKTVVPALNTLFLGDIHRAGVYTEYCSACGQCLLDVTGGLCPVTRCAKHLLNGPCGGSTGGKCEANPDIDCVWHQIVDRMKELGRDQELTEVVPARDWSSPAHGHPRRIGGEKS